jgi:putative membrane protein
MMGMGFGLIFMLVFWGGLILLAVWLVRALFSATPGGGPKVGERGPSAQQILDQRYARGEISREQYEIMKQDLYGEAQNPHH